MPYPGGEIGSGQHKTNHLSKTGADFTGGNGATNRTYDLGSAALTDTPIVIINRAALHLTQDFTFSAGVITIVEGLDNADIVDIWYYTIA